MLIYYNMCINLFKKKIIIQLHLTKFGIPTVNFSKLT